MGDAITEQTALSRDHVRIDRTLDWYFNFAEGDVGLQSNHGATVSILINRKDRTATNADAAEEAMFRAVEAVTRHRCISAVLARLSDRDRYDLRQCYASRRWLAELVDRPAAHRAFAASSPAVRNYLRAQGTGWTPDAGQALLVLAQQLAPDVVEFDAVRVDAWTFAERAAEALFDRYAAAERAVAAEAATLRDRPRARAARAAAPRGTPLETRRAARRPFTRNPAPSGRAVTTASLRARSSVPGVLSPPQNRSAHGRANRVHDRASNLDTRRSRACEEGQKARRCKVIHG